MLISGALFAGKFENGKDTSRVAKAPGADTSEVKTGKHDIAINVVPVIQFLTGASTGGNVQRFSFMYRQRLKNGCYLRFGIMFDKVKTSYYNAKDSAFTVVSQTDTSQFRKYDRGSLVYIKPALLFGFEKEAGRKRLKHFYGADLAIGVYHYYNKQYYHTYLSDPTNQNDPWKPSTTPDNLIQRIDYKVLFFGLMPFYGLRYQFTEHWILSAQVGLNVFADVGQTITENGNLDTFSAPYHKLNTTSPGLVNDISLIIRF